MPVQPCISSLNVPLLVNPDTGEQWVMDADQLERNIVALERKAALMDKDGRREGAVLMYAADKMLRMEGSRQDIGDLAIDMRKLQALMEMGQAPSNTRN